MLSSGGRSIHWAVELNVDVGLMSQLHKFFFRTAQWCKVFLFFFLQEVKTELRWSSDRQQPGFSETSQIGVIDRIRHHNETRVAGYRVYDRFHLYGCDFRPCWNLDALRCIAEITCCNSCDIILASMISTKLEANEEKDVSYFLYKYSLSMSDLRL